MFLLGVVGDQVRVDVQDQALAASGAGGGYEVSGLVGLQPVDLACLVPGRPQCVEDCLVDAGQHAPGGRGEGDRAEYLALVAQHGQVGDRLAAVGEHHREVHRDAAGVVTGPARPQPVQGFAEVAGQRGGSARSASRHEPAWPTTPFPSALMTRLGRPGIVHAESAFLLERLGP